MACNVQQTVHLLTVPFEVAELINSFLFYSMETVIKETKKIINYKISNAYYSRKNMPEGTIRLGEDKDTVEHWAFEAFYTQREYELFYGEHQFQAISCKKCGNYKPTIDIIVPKNALCYCTQ